MASRACTEDIATFGAGENSGASDSLVFGPATGSLARKDSSLGAGLARGSRSATVGVRPALPKGGAAAAEQIGAPRALRDFVMAVPLSGVVDALRVLWDVFIEQKVSWRGL